MSVELFKALQLNPFPEQIEQTRMHGDGGGGLVLSCGDPNLTQLAAVPITFPLICEEPLFMVRRGWRYPVAEVVLG